MTGYQEMLTDPSFAGQVLVLTYPLAGNYGINRESVESKRIQVRGLVVHEACSLPSHWRSEMTLHEYLVSQDIPGISGVDTRARTPPATPPSSTAASSTTSCASPAPAAAVSPPFPRTRPPMTSSPSSP